MNHVCYTLYQLEEFQGQEQIILDQKNTSQQQ